MPTLVVEPEGLRVSFSEGTDLLTVLRNAGVNIENVCGGRGVCKKCIAEAKRGAFSDPTQAENEAGLPSRGLRLACQARVLGDGVVAIPGSSRQTRGRILEWGRLAKVRFSPAITFLDVDVEKPSLEDQRSDAERLADAAKAQSVSDELLRRLPGKLRDLNWKAKAILHEREVIDLKRQDDKMVCGLAVDVGTTTVVGHLVDLADGRIMATKSDYNGQIVFGDDVISRMNYSIRDYEKLKELQSRVVATINDIASAAAEQAGCSTSDIYELTFAGNTVMTSFLVGAEASAIATTPYVPSFRSSLSLSAKTLGLKANDSARAYTLPQISGYVGADVVADILVSGMHNRDEISLLIDLGTNGEVVLGSKHGMLAASTAAGPALEGAGLSSGMRGMEGAIESVSVDTGTYEVFYRTIGDRKPRGICGSGVVDSIAWMLIAGLLDHSGRMLKTSAPNLVDLNGERAFVLVPGDASDGGRPICVTQGDIRRFQLAKGAIFTAYLILMRISHLTVDSISKVYVAGAFGNYIDPRSATVVGMIPEVPQDKITPIGNGSGNGAMMALISGTAREEAERVGRFVKAIDLNTVREFQAEFVNATNMPHRNLGLFPKVARSLEHRVPFLG